MIGIPKFATLVRCKLLTLAMVGLLGGMLYFRVQLEETLKESVIVFGAV